ncbi:polysaccharide deacetylase family protein [Rhizobium sp. IMFF44]|uniref:polysaccharide deacetylase family protein n=1 Tax=Rhizobium sp. IMFF44 TaxID=3342350 RepID=UPI0035B9390F
MIGVIATNRSQYAADLVTAALRRSFSVTQVRQVAVGALEMLPLNILVAIDPDNTLGECLLQWLKCGGRKLVLFGNVPAAIVSTLNIKSRDRSSDFGINAISKPAKRHQNSSSAIIVQYGANATAFEAGHWQRPLERFDFADEWNNEGYGAIRADGSIWALAISCSVPGENELAGLHLDSNYLGSYAALFDYHGSGILWYNRAVGPIDSYEWRLVEKFLASWRQEALACNPVLHEIPWGYDSAITMRLDCDEDIESARLLWNVYREMDIPFSLAVHTINLNDKGHHSIVREMIDAGESILSHSATHAANWGGTYQAALIEAKTAADEIRSVANFEPRYAVSPFHQSPSYALAALVDAGYQGCIGGIIRNDPEFLMARGGSVAHLPRGFVGHSQQCMLHGDCMLDDGDPLRIYKSAFDRAHETMTLFGYLDHPFSERYQYGWRNEEERAEAHVGLLHHIRSKSARPIFLGENEAMDFLAWKAEHDIIWEDGTFRLITPPPSDRWKRAQMAPTLEYKGQLFEATANGFAS